MADYFSSNSFLGLVIFLMILVEFCKLILKLQRKNLFLMWVGLSLVIYKLICSVGETAFFHPMAALPFILLGLIINIANDNKTTTS